MWEGLFPASDGFRATSRVRNFSVQCCLVSLHLGNSCEDNGVSGLENVVFQRCLSAQPGPTALQRFNRFKCALLLLDLAAIADLPPHSVLLSQQLLHLTHRWWSEAEGSDIEVNDIYLLAAQAYTCIKLHSARYPEPVPFQLLDPRQPARSLTDLLTALAAILDRRQPHSVPLLHSAQSVHEVVAEDELGTYTLGDWVRLFKVRFSLRIQQLRQRSPQATSLLSRVPSGVVASGASPMTMSRTAHSPWTPCQVTSGALHGLFSSVIWVRLLQTGVHWEVQLRWFGPPLSELILELSLTLGTPYRTSCFLLHKRILMSSTSALNIKRGFSLKHITHNVLKYITKLHFGSAAHPSKITLRWC